MELALSLGDTPKPFSPFLQKSPHQKPKISSSAAAANLGLICMAVETKENETTDGHRRPSAASSSSSDPPPLQLELLPFSPVQKNSQPSSSTKFPFPWLTEKLGADFGRGMEAINRKGNELSAADQEAASPNSTAVSSFQVDFSVFRSARGKREFEQLITTSNGTEGETDRGASSRGSDDDENGMARKKLRLSKEQSAFLEESFKEHSTLNPKQKLALAKQLNLRPRQVEVWFQNRRARTKLKQTEVDCEYLKRCCETLTEENRRLQKELQELRALKASKPFYMQLPATTLTMCPSCERVATTTTAASPPATAAASKTPSKSFPLSPSRAQDQQ